MANASVKVVGLDKVTANINREIAGVKGRSIAGLYAAALKVQRLAQQRVPVEHGILRASAYTRKESEQQVVVGFGAAYAIYVHEDMEQKLKGQPRPSGLGVYWGPAGQPKFLESAFTELKDEIIETVAQYANVGGKK